MAIYREGRIVIFECTVYEESFWVAKMCNREIPWGGRSCSGSIAGQAIQLWITWVAADKDGLWFEWSIGVQLASHDGPDEMSDQQLCKLDDNLRQDIMVAFFTQHFQSSISTILFSDLSETGFEPLLGISFFPMSSRNPSAYRDFAEKLFCHCVVLFDALSNRHV